MKKNRISIIIISVILAVLLIIVTGRVRVHLADSEAAEIAKNAGIDFHYKSSPEISSKEELYLEVVGLALWEEQLRDKLNAAYDYKDWDYDKSAAKSRSGFESRIKLQGTARYNSWIKNRIRLESETENYIREIWGGQELLYGIDRKTVTESFENDRFASLANAWESLEKGDGKRAYSKANRGLAADWSALPMDIVYTLQPELITEGCEAALKEAVAAGNLSILTNTIDAAEQFSERYGVSITNLKMAERRKKVLEAKKNTEQQKTREGSSSYSTPSSSGNRPSSHAGSSYSYDPDDHDIEAYYEDNRDEYDDYDDAYEGFLDDEGVWDDY